MTSYDTVTSNGKFIDRDGVSLLQLTICFE